VAPAMVLRAMFRSLPMPSMSSRLAPGSAASFRLLYLFVLASRAANDFVPAEVAHITRRFSTLGIVSVATLLVTGLINTWFLVGSVAILVGSTYGELLMIKVVLFLVMVGIAAINRTWLTPMLTASAVDARAKAARRLTRNSLIEASLGLAILAIVGALGTLPPELPDEHHMHSHVQ
jgi:putative copper export protein